MIGCSKCDGMAAFRADEFLGVDGADVLVRSTPFCAEHAPNDDENSVFTLWGRWAGLGGDRIRVKCAPLPRQMKVTHDGRPTNEPTHARLDGVFG